MNINAYSIFWTLAFHFYRVEGRISGRLNIGSHGKRENKNKVWAYVSPRYVSLFFTLKLDTKNHPKVLIIQKICLICHYSFRSYIIFLFLPGERNNSAV